MSAFASASGWFSVPVRAGFIPGMTFRFGTSFGRAADAALALLQARTAEQSARRAREAKDEQTHPPPAQLSIRGRDVVPEAIAQDPPHKYKGGWTRTASSAMFTSK